MNALAQRFDYKVRRSNHTQFIAICKNRDCQWVFKTEKSRNGTSWNVTSVDSKHTCGANENYNVDCQCESAQVIGQLLSRQFVNPGRHISSEYISVA
ncbi:hypothetical protein Ddye_012714 [Dipteronia dyeriana]|uniref:Transposase MuDR plant domain-containing protein n=1 Tax=Dipteronia dyeriana TaxID=168575 RepID=A0AAE0CJI3_9ROSI|nr:hypothetical protein Ddye_012714 [Dipteronia dyeriana]